MILITLFAFLSLIVLIILHELGHFLVAKIFGVKVEEFGIFLPPRLVGKKIGETVYSLNLLPFGAFVKLYGEEGGIENVRSFSGKPVWQRALIVVGGVATFWIVSAILLSVVMGLGIPIAVSDEENGDLIDPKIQIAGVAPESPAEIAGIKLGDTVKELRIQDLRLKINKIKDLQDFIEEHKGKEIILTFERGREFFEVSLIPRVSPPENEGAIGVSLVRTTIKSYSWHQAPIQGIITTFNLTISVIRGWFQVLTLTFRREPTGVQLMGPVGIISLFTQFGKMGVNYFLQFVAIISIYFALFNILPIPALDGGKLVFLGIEAIRKKPVSVKTEQKITTVFFTLLIALVILVTVKDIIGLF